MNIDLKKPLFVFKILDMYNIYLKIFSKSKKKNSNAFSALNKKQIPNIRYFLLKLDSVQALM